uniref:Low density lipoprotein receptor-related protein 11 n=1 Tax=Nannospalax galili TaxID=1026970 RepID=A0A8C6RJJ6_NANGA
SAPLSELHQLLEDFHRQLQQERPHEELELELRAGGGRREDCPGPGGDGYSAAPDAIIRTKDSIAAGARFLSAPATVRDWRQCVAACCSEPRCSVAVLELPRRPAAPGAALGCYLFNCTARGRSVCRFAPHRGYRTYTLSRAPAADNNSSGKNRKEENYIFESKSKRGRGEHPAPEAGAVLPLALGLAITALLLLMVACRLRLVKQKLKKARPITSEESDYLINGMYL